MGGVPKPLVRSAPSSCQRLRQAGDQAVRAARQARRHRLPRADRGRRPLHRQHDRLPRPDVRAALPPDGPGQRARRRAPCTSRAATSRSPTSPCRCCPSAAPATPSRRSAACARSRTWCRTQMRFEVVPGGHLGMLTGRAPRETTWRILDDFIDEHASDAGRTTKRASGAKKKSGGSAKAGPDSGAPRSRPAPGPRPRRRRQARDRLAGARRHRAQRAGRAGHRLQPQPAVLLGQLAGAGGPQAWRQLTPGGCRPPAPPAASTPGPDARRAALHRGVRRGAGARGAGGLLVLRRRPALRRVPVLGTGRAQHAPTSAEEPPTFTSYAALGDSYTAAPFVPVTDLAEGCLRSNGNYPALLAAELGIEDVRDVSCSAAETGDVEAPQQVAGGQGTVAPQLRAVTRGTDLVTVGLGGNDEDLFATLVGCVGGFGPAAPGATATPTPGRCLGTDVGAPTAAIARTGDRVEAALEAVTAKAPGAEVVLVGYPRCWATPAGAGSSRSTRATYRRRSSWRRRCATRSPAPRVARASTFLDTYALVRGPRDLLGRPVGQRPPDRPVARAGLPPLRRGPAGRRRRPGRRAAGSRRRERHPGLPRRARPGGAGLGRGAGPGRGHHRGDGPLPARGGGGRARLPARRRPRAARLPAPPGRRPGAHRRPGPLPDAGPPGGAELLRRARRAAAAAEPAQHLQGARDRPGAPDALQRRPDPVDRAGRAAAQPLPHRAAGQLGRPPRQGLGGRHRPGDRGARRPRRPAGRGPLGRRRPQAQGLAERGAVGGVGAPLARCRRATASSARGRSARSTSCSRPQGGRPVDWRLP